jgi:hypothetical protein
MHSDHKAQIFDVFVHQDPKYLECLSPLLILSVAATVSEDFTSYLRERVHWIEVCLTAVNKDVSRKGV